MTAQDLKNSILQQAVQGKLVLQDPSDKPIDLKNLKLKNTDECELDIPEIWKLAHLESITKGIPSKQYQILESEVKQNGQFAVISQSKAYSIGFTDNKEKVFCHQEPVVVFGDHTTEVKIVDFDFVVGADGVKIFEPNSNVITAKFLYYVLQFYSIGLSKVGGYSRHYKFIKNKPIPLPPLAEQERIVSKIEELMPLVEEYGKTEEQIKALNAEFPDKLRKSILQQAVQGKLTERDPSDEPASEVLKRTHIEKTKLIAEGKIKKEKLLPPITNDEKPFDIPDTWEWARISDVTFFQEGPGILAKDFRVSGVPLIRIAGMQGENVSLAGCNYLDPLMVADKWNHFRLEQGDIVISTSASLDKIATATKEAEGAISFTGLIRFKMFNGLMPEYFVWFIKSPLYIMQINMYKKGDAIKHYGPTHLKQMIIPVPPLAEQKRIVARVEELLAVCDGLK